MKKIALPTDLPSTERLFNAGYFTLADNLTYYLWRGAPLTKNEREELKTWFRLEPDSPYPFKAYERWELESDFHELVEALTGTAACPPSCRDLVGLPGGASKTRARRTRGSGRSSPLRTEARVPLRESPEGDNARSLEAREPDAA